MRKSLIKFLPLFGLVCMLLLSFVLAAHASTSTGIIIDGDPSDWTSAGLSPVGTDPPYNTHSYNSISSDLLEAWACKNETMLFLMMKVRGGTPDFDSTDYMVMLNIDPEGNTGDQDGNDYFVSQMSYGGYLFTWNTTTLDWNYPLSNSKVTGKAGGLGYIEWGVPLNEIGGNASNLKLDFNTYDSIYKQSVNDIIVTLSPPVTIQDTVPPTVGTPIQSPSDIIGKGQEVKVSVNITDSGSGVKNATLLYTIINGSSLETPMNYNATTGYYETTISGQLDGTTVKYQITAYDLAGNIAVNDNAGQYYVYTVIPELSLLLILPLFMIATLLAVIVCKKKGVKTSQS